jgi:hypothetical protein
LRPRPSWPGAVFLLMPLKFAFVRPSSGPVFDWFHTADLPFNQLPSLHVALLLIVGDVFVRRSRGWVRAALLVWFGLIAASPLLVCQHHLTDLVAGLALGLLCLHFIRDEFLIPPFERNRRVATYYSAAAIFTIGTSICLGKCSWPLWWPAMSLSIVAIGYWFVGPAIYGKTDGRISLAAKLLLWPVLLGQHASLRWYGRRCRPHDAVTDRLWIGRQLSESEAAAARVNGVGAVIDLTCEFTEPRSFREWKTGGALRRGSAAKTPRGRSVSFLLRVCAFLRAAFFGREDATRMSANQARQAQYLQLPVLDLTAPTSDQIDQAVKFIEKHAAHKIVYIHCKVGYSRSAVIAAAYLLATGRADSVDHVIAMLRAARPTIIIRPEARRAIEKLHADSRADSAAPEIDSGVPRLPGDLW